MSMKKKNEKGELVDALPEDLFNYGLQLYQEDGKEFTRPNAPIIAKELDPITELAGIVKDAVASVNTLKETVEAQKEKLSKYDEAVRRGIVIPMAKDPAVPADQDPLTAGYELARQGKDLSDKFRHPIHQIDEPTRIELAKYFLSLTKASRKNPRPSDVERFWDAYGRNWDNPAKHATRPLGDATNLFPTPDIVESEILAFAREKSVVLQYARIWPMTSDKQSFPQESQVSSVSWGNTTPQSDPLITEVQLDALELSAFTEARNTTLADSTSDIVSWLTEMMAEAVGQELDNEAFNGTGTNCMSGILSAACGYSASLTGGSTAFSLLAAKDVSVLISKLDGLRKQGARFFMHGSIIHYIRLLADHNGKPIFLETIGGAVPGTIYGYPYSEVIKMPSTSAATTAYIAFGNLRYLAVGQRLQSTALDVDPYGLWTTNRTRFKVYNRWAMKMGLPKGFARLLTA